MAVGLGLSQSAHGFGHSLGDVEGFAQGQPINAYSNGGPSQTNELVFEWFKMLTQQTPAATRVQPA